ncbi:hypothetical protein V8J88_09810 [Massilia sp. W12]|uniref:hypothetical protein n=1 Tax=Massilia sp. W12 TaxID=3126507 RepID=UPI0030D40EC0
MSRSYRHTPIFPLTNSDSERDDKQRWHRRWRRNQRTRLADAVNHQAPAEKLEAISPLPQQAYSNVWLMDKDGRNWWTAQSRAGFAMRHALRGQSVEEQNALRLRSLRRLMGK